MRNILACSRPWPSLPQLQYVMEGKWFVSCGPIRGSRFTIARQLFCTSSPLNGWMRCDLSRLALVGLVTLSVGGHRTRGSRRWLRGGRSPQDDRSPGAPSSRQGAGGAAPGPEGGGQRRETVRGRSLALSGDALPSGRGAPCCQGTYRFSRRGANPLRSSKRTLIGYPQGVMTEASLR